MTNKKLSFAIDDFISDTFSMTTFQKGCYMNVVAGQSKRGRLTIPEIKQILMDDFDEAWPSIEYIFEIDQQGRYYIESLDRALSKKKKMKENAMKRWGNATATNISSFQTTSDNTKWQSQVKEHPAMGNINFSAPVKKILGTTAVTIPTPVPPPVKASPVAQSTKQITASPKPKVATDTVPPVSIKPFDKKAIEERRAKELEAEEGCLEERIKMAFGEMQITNLEMQYKETNIPRLLADFLKKVRSLPENYENHDIKGLKYAFISHLKTYGKNFVKGVVPMVIDPETGIERPEYYTTPHLTPEQKKVFNENAKRANEFYKSALAEDEKRKANSKPLTDEQRKILAQKMEEINKSKRWVHDDNEQKVSKYEWEDNGKDKGEDDIPQRIAKIKEEMARKKALAEEEEMRKAGTNENAQ